MGFTHLSQVNIVNYWIVQYGVYTSLTGKYSLPKIRINLLNVIL